MGCVVVVGSGGGGSDGSCGGGGGGKYRIIRFSSGSFHIYRGIIRWPAGQNLTV